MRSSNPQDLLEQQELLQKLIDAGYGEFVDVFLSNENLVYTKKARLNKSGACRVLGCKTKELEDILAACKAIIDPDGDEATA